MKSLRAKLTYANVMATIAVFIALGGASYAAIKLPKNSVGTKQLKKGSVTAAKIKRKAITGAKVDLSSLGAVPNAVHAAGADSAANAISLNGQPSSSFQPANRFFSGTASLAVASPQTLIDVPNGPDLTTAGTGANEFTIRVYYPPTGSGTEKWGFYGPSGALPNLVPGGGGGLTLSGSVGAVTLINQAQTRILPVNCAWLSASTSLTCSGVIYGTG